MAMGGGGAGDYKSDINITPLVDVVLVLLIIFMVITPLLQMGYDVKVPPKTTAAGPPPPPDLLIVSLTPANKIYLNKEEVNVQTLSLRLTEILKNRANKTIFFSGRRRLQLRRGHQDHGPLPQRRGQEHRHRDGGGSDRALGLSLFPNSPKARPGRPPGRAF